MHDLPLISTIAAAFTAAWLLGLLTQKLRLSPIVGYLVAGVLIGPHTPGFVGDVHLAQQLAEVGVILLMFGVGLHFHLKDLIAVKNMAIPGAIGQSLIATVAAMLIFSAFGMPMKTGAVLGMAMASAGFLALTHLSMAAAKCHDSSPLPIFRCGDRLANVVGVRAIGRHGGLSPGMPELAAVADVLTHLTKPNPASVGLDNTPPASATLPTLPHTRPRSPAGQIRGRILQPKMNRRGCSDAAHEPGPRGIWQSGRTPWPQPTVLPVRSASRTHAPRSRCGCPSDNRDKWCRFTAVPQDGLS